ncbi:MAG: hypothetical protein LBL76_07905 [Treponema sp.]|jgi:predicted nucleotidyltransferase|nr:hypothetical protein [Treponema sp.]
MITEIIIRIKDCIIRTTRDDCEKILLFGSYVHGTPGKSSDYNFYIVMKEGSEKPVLVLQNIYRQDLLIL